MKYFWTIILFFFAFPGWTCPEEKPKTKKTPVKTLKVLLLTSRSSFINWQGGGVNSFNISLRIDGDFKNHKKNWTQTNNIDIGLGFLKQEKINLQKSEDFIHYNFTLGYSPFKNHIFELMLDLDFRTQFTDGYNYKANPYQISKELPVKISDFFSPAYFTQSLNITFNQTGWYNGSLGFGLKQTIVSQEEIRELFNLPAEQSILVEYGISSKIKLKKEIGKNVLIDSQFDFFASMNSGKKPDIRWNNKLDFKFNSWFSFRFEFEIFYDTDIIEKLQMRELMSLGLTLNFFHPKDT